MATKVSETSITCTICLSRFRNPRMLPCLHSFCEDCIVSYAPKGTQSMTCPLCKDKIEIPGGDVTKFKHDFRLQSQVDDATSYEQLAIGSGPELECNCCDDGQEAIARCLECEQFLCQLGMKCHDKIKGLQNHPVFTIEELRSGRIDVKSVQHKHRMCTSHTDEKARYYCHSCHDFICRECTVLDHPKPDHEYSSVTGAAERYKEKIKEKLVDIAKIRDDFKVSEEIALKKAVDVEKESSAAFAQLREEAGELRARIDAMENERSDEIERVQQQRNEKVAEYICEFKDIRESSDHIMETVREIMENAGDEEFLYLYSTLDMKMGNLCDKKTPRNIEIDGAYMVYNQLTTKNVEMGKLVIPEIVEWGVTQTLGNELANKDNGLISVALHQNGELVCLLRNRSAVKSTVAIPVFTQSGDLKHSFEVGPVAASEEHSPTLASDLCIMPNGNIAVFKYYNIDIYQITGTLEKRINLKRKLKINPGETNDAPQTTDSESKEVNDDSTERAEGTNNSTPNSSDDSKLEAGSDDSVEPSATSNSPSSDSKLETESDDSAKSPASEGTPDPVLPLGSLRVIVFGKEHHFLASFDDHRYIGLYNALTGDLKKHIDVNFHPSRLTIVDKESFLVTGAEKGSVPSKIYHMKLDGELIKAIPMPSEITVPFVAVCYDSAASQIYVSAFKTEPKEGDKSVILQYSSSGVYLGCTSTKAKSPYDIRVIGSNKMAVADFENIKILTKG